MKKLNKKILIVIVGVAIIVIAGISLANSRQPKGDISAATLNKGELIKSITISGIVKSADAKKIYSKESLPVKEVRVEVGDHVKKGDILAILDADSITKELEKANVMIASHIKSKEDQEQSIQSEIALAEKKVRAAQITLEKQKSSYDKIYNEYQLGTNSELLNAKMTLDKAEIEQNVAQKDYENNKQLFEEDFISKSEYESLENSYKKAVISYDNAVKAYDFAKESFEQDYKGAQADLETAKNSYETDIESLKASKQKNTASYNYNIEQQKIDAERLKNRVDDCIIKATADGTVTAVNVKVGQTPTGIIFELEDTEHLKITTYIKEYDIANVKVGQKVMIKSDGTKDKIINGQVSAIAPTTRKDSTSKNSEFETEINITDMNSGLKIGMEARMNIILDQKTDVFYTTYDSVLTRSDGQKVIYIDDKGTVKEILVKEGIDSEVYVEIQGDGLTQGMQVITNPAEYTPGEETKTK